MTSTHNILTSYFLPERILKRRWLIPFVFITLLTLHHESVALMARQQIGASINAWDIVMDLFNSRLSVHHGLTNLLIFLVSDIALFEELDQLALLRAGSRWRWFQVQAGCVFATVGLYVALIVVIVLGITVTTIPWSLAWSPAAMSILNRQGLPANGYLALSPLPTVLFMLTLLGLAWIGISVVVSAITLITQNPIFGFAAGLALNYSTLIIWLDDIHSPLLDAIWFHQRMFLWHTDVTGSLIGLFTESVLYWAIWITISMIGLWSVCRSISIFRRNST